jgi:CIC family chloride channel protein
VIQIGSAIGSTIAQLTKQKQPEIRLLLSAGAAAAIGGTFGAPIAGVLFTIEVLKNRFYSLSRGMVIVLAAFIGAYGAEFLTGRPGLRFGTDFVWQFNISELMIITSLGVASALAALFFGKILKLTQRLFKVIAIPTLLKPALGGMMVGLIGLYLPYVHEPAAYPLMIDLIALSSLPLTILGIILVIKILATSITLGSGGAGGIFAPLLLIGAIVGSVFATGVVFLDLTMVSSPALLVLAGMAAVFAGAALAPLTAGFIAYELTENISLLIPLLIISFMSSYTAKLINKESIYHQE